MTRKGHAGMFSHLEQTRKRNAIRDGKAVPVTVKLYPVEEALQIAGLVSG